MAPHNAFQNNKNQNGRWIKILDTYALSRSAIKQRDTFDTFFKNVQHNGEFLKFFLELNAVLRTCIQFWARSNSDRQCNWI